LPPALFFEDPGAFPSRFAPVGFVWSSHALQTTISLLPNHEISNTVTPSSHADGNLWRRRHVAPAGIRGAVRAAERLKPRGAVGLSSRRPAR
jgi:hypothetical protein